MSTERARRWYESRKRAFKRMYWEGERGDIYRPSGFKSYPREVYDLFAELVDRDGRVIDLGCGNGLLLRHLVSQAGKKLEPYGVDFIEESIEQAKTVILPEYAENFAVSNLVDYSLKPGSFDFILVDPYDIHRDDLEGFLEMVLGACRPGGRVIFYTYRDVLRVLLALSIVALLLPPLRKRLPHRIYGVARSVKNLFPPHIASRLKTIEHRHVSIGVYECTKEASPRAFQP